MDAKTRPFKKGMIILWYGSIASIPSGWALCDGDNGTPDLDARFVQGAGIVRTPGQVGGSSSHTHPFSDVAHVHEIIGGGQVSAGADFSNFVGGTIVSGTTDSGSNVPLYHALCHIMKL